MGSELKDLKLGAQARLGASLRERKRVPNDCYRDRGIEQSIVPQSDPVHLLKRLEIDLSAGRRIKIMRGGAEVTWHFAGSGRRLLIGWRMLLVAARIVINRPQGCRRNVGRGDHAMGACRPPLLDHAQHNQQRPSDSHQLAS